MKAPSLKCAYGAGCADMAAVDLASEAQCQISRALSDFMYLPNSDRVIQEMRSRLESMGAAEVEIDRMDDLGGKADACRECAAAGSYEEYRLKRAAANMPDEAGSEREWCRMSQYSPGVVFVRLKTQQDAAVSIQIGRV